MKTFLLLANCLVILSTSMTSAQTGALDFSFDGDGRLTTSFQKPVFVRSTASVVQKDGKTVVIGYEGIDFIPGTCYIARFNDNGSLDNTFGQGGKIKTLENELFHPNAIVVQQNGKIVVVGYASAPNNNFENKVMLVRFNTNGTLDNTFSQDGKVITQIGKSSAGNSVSIQNDNKIIVAGYTENGSDLDFLVMRYNTDGTLDNSFNGTGIITRFGSTTDAATTIAVLPNGKIVAAGYIDNDGYDFIVARYTSSGKLDKTFDADGVVITDIAGDDRCLSMALQTDGKIILAGKSYPVNGMDNLISLSRYNTDGTLDATFSGDGKHTEALGETYGVESMVIDANGKIIVGAHSNSFGAVLRFNTDASLDVTFSGDGKLYTSLELLTVDFNYYNFPVNVNLQEGKIVFSGSYKNVDANDFVVFRYTSNGKIDKTYSSDGIALAEFKAENVGSSVQSVAIQPDKKIVVAGSPGLARYNTNGTLDTTFNLNGEGIITLTLDGRFNPYGVAIQTDGKIVIAGRYDNLLEDFAVVRLNPNGTPDKTFGINGLVATDFSNSVDYVETGCLALQADGKIVVAGYTFNSSYDVAIARYNTDGTLDKTFDGDGKVTTDIENRYQVGRAIAIQTDGKIVVAGDAMNSSNNTDIAVFRYTTSGGLDPTFNSTGIKTTDIAQHDDHGLSVKIQANGKIVVGGFAFTNPNRDFTVVRYNTNGSHDNTFSGNGNVTTAIETGSNDYGTSVAIQADGKILLGGYYNSSNGRLNNFALVRFNANGNIDNSFGNAGRKVTDFGSTEDYAYSIALQPDGQLVMAGSSAGNFAVARFLTAAPFAFATTASDNEELKKASATIFSVSPNPLFSKATIAFFLEKNENVSIELYDGSGRKIKSLVRGFTLRGFHQIEINKGILAPGIYHLRLITTTQELTKKIVIQ